MYSPKIRENLIPLLYRASKDRGIPMTKLVNCLIHEGLTNQNLPQIETDAPASCTAGNKPRAMRQPKTCYPIA